MLISIKNIEHLIDELNCNLVLYFYEILYLDKKYTMMNVVRFLMERSAFGVCASLGNHLGLSIERIRLYFVYLSLLTFGSPVIIYLVAAFFLNLKRYLLPSKYDIRL